jgi:hypothetical protein
MEITSIDKFKYKFFELYMRLNTFTKLLCIFLLTLEQSHTLLTQESVRHQNNWKRALLL